MKRKLMTVAFALTISGFCFAQTENTNRYPSEKGFITNGFFDNIELSIGAGGQIFSLTGSNKTVYNNYGVFKDRISAEMEISVSKWLTPVWGGRIQAQGAWIYGFPNKVDYTAEINQAGIGKYTFEDLSIINDKRLRHKNYYSTVQFQVMADLSNWIGGYRPGRIYHAVAFGGIGWIGSLNKNNKSDEWAGSFGLNNRFRACNFLDVYLEIKSLVMKTNWYNPQGVTLRATMIPSVSAGLTFRLPHQDFKRVPHCDYQPFYNQIDSLNNALKNTKDENSKLSNDLKNAKDSLDNTKKNLSNTKLQLDSCQNDLKKKPKVIEKIIIQKPTEEEQKALKESFDAIYFKSGKDVIETTSFASLNKAAKILKKYPKTVIKVSGHTDNIGNETNNIKLSQKRANAVKNYLVKKGVKATITAEGYGPLKPIADNSTEEGRAENRRTEIEIE